MHPIDNHYATIVALQGMSTDSLYFPPGRHRKMIINHGIIAIRINVLWNNDPWYPFAWDKSMDEHEWK
jgi:hypothetical protein